MLKPNFLKQLLFAGCFILFINFMHAAIVPASDRIYTSSLLSPIVIGTSAATKTPEIVPAPSSGSPFTDHSVIDKITFGVDPKCTFFMPTAGEIKVILKLEKYNTAGTSIISTTYPELTLQYQPFSYTSPYIDKSVLVFNGTYKYTFTIQSITQNGNSTTILPANLFIDGDIQVERYYDFASIANTNSGIPNTISKSLSNLDCDNIDDEIKITWDKCFTTTNGFVCPEEYQLEWTFVNDYDDLVAPHDTVLDPANLNYNFRNNSSRVTTSNNYYSITLAFEHGYFLYRVRAVGRDLTDPTKYIYGLWSEAESGIVDLISSKYYNTIEHEGNKNWQYSTTYAEEGKKKEVVSYFDGSLRNRQSVTKVNSDKNTIVGETIYDYQGRPAINVLPVPVPPVCIGTDKEPSLKFYPTFNQNTASPSVEYSRKDFDEDAPNRCINVPNGMNTVTGAANYYSPFNPVKTGQQAFVPDATAADQKGYPYTQIEYTPDNTGRIRKQGGVGFVYQLGNNHETQYFYGQPFQPQLDRMFGSEVGDAAHYKKNVVVDANGQVSISYLDQEGRTIATSLAGDAPKDANSANIVSTIPSGVPVAQLLNVDLFAKNSNGVSNVNTKNTDGDAIIFNTQLTVDYKSDFTFNYSLDVDPYQNKCLKPNICFDCVYDLEVRVTDDCNTILHTTSSTGSAITRKIGKFDLNTDGSISFKLQCPSSPHLHETETFTLSQLPVGNYTVSKVLTIDHDARDFYVKAYLDSTNNDCVKTLYDFTAAALLNIDTSSCNVSCDQCAHSLQTVNGSYYSDKNQARDAFVAAGNGTELEFDVLYEDCGAPCKTLTWCEATYQQLLMDVSPDGQYAQFQTNAGITSPGSFPLSVLNTSNTLPKSVSGVQANWRNPVIGVGGTIYHYYLEEDGTRSVMHITPDGLGGFIPAVVHNDYSLAPANVYIKYDVAGDFYYTYPENLANVEDFVGGWNINWAKSLVQYHPEYCYYESCQAYSVKQSGDNQTTDYLDELLNNANSYTEAVTKGLLEASYGVGATPTVSPIDNMGKFTTTSSTLKDPFLFNAAYSGYGAALAYKVHHYQTFGSTTYSMIEVAAITARCGTMFGTSPVSASCKRFGSDVGTDPNENKRIRDMEWNLFKNFYLSEKRKLQQKRADDNARTMCKGYNGCIGNADYNPYLSGMEGHFFSGSSFFMSPYFDISQPCSIYLKSLYLDKRKRFYGPEDIHSPSPQEMDYQVFLQTGQCPLAMDFQTLLSGLAGRKELDNSTGADLTQYGEFTNDMYVEISGGTQPVVFTPYLWKGTNAGSVLKAEFFNTLNQTTVCKVNLDKSGSGITNWDDIVSISQLKYTSTSGSQYNFTVMAGILTSPGSSTITYTMLTGNTCVKITGCTFPPQCEGNDFAHDLGELMTALSINSELTIPNIHLDISPSNYTSFITNSIKSALHTTQTTLNWKFTGQEFILYDNTNPSKRLRIKFTSFTPSTFNYGNLNAVKGFTNIKSNYQNFFTMDGVNLNGDKIVSINGSVDYIDGSITSGVSMGSCGLPDPLSCEGDPYELRGDLEALLKNAIKKQAYTGDIDLTQSPKYTTLVSSYFPAGLTSTSSTEIVHTGVGGFIDSLIFKITDPDKNAACDLVLYHKGPQPTILLFKYLTDLTSLTATGTTDIDNNYYSFYAIGTYSVNNHSFVDTIYGRSCLPLQNCNPCSQTPEPACVMCKEIKILQPVSICMNTPVIFAYDSHDCNGTPRLLWNFGDGTVSSNGTHTYLGSGNYTVSLSSIKSEHCPEIFAKVSITVNNCNNTLPALKDPIYFNAADSIKLASGVLINDTTVNAYLSYVSKLSVLDSINGWNIGDSAYIPPTSYAMYFANGYKFSSNYNDFVQNFDVAIDSILYLRDIRKFVADYGNLTNCEKEYKRYVRAVNKYNQQAISLGYSQITAITDSSFYADMLCDGSKVFINYLKAFPENGQTPVNVKSYLVNNIILPDPGPCATLYTQYVTAYNLYAQNQLQNPTCPQYARLSPLYSYDDFVSAKLCSTTGGLAQFNAYILTFNNLVDCPGSMPIANGSGMDVKMCNELYNKFKQVIADYNVSAFAIAHNYLLDVNLYNSFSQFIKAGLCDCAKDYINYLSSFINLPANSNTPAALDIDHYAPCINNVSAPPDPCKDAYARYLEAIANYNEYAMRHKELGLPLITNIYKEDAFTAAGFCYCVDGYVAFLNTIINGTADLSRENRDKLYVLLDISKICPPSIKPPCEGALPQDVFQHPRPKYSNPCVEQQLNLARANAANAYQHYVDSLTTFISNAYTQHCMKAIESFTGSYYDKEYHFTLYYYDQAGNLVRTIPPEGFHPVNLATFQTAITSDRTYGTHTVFTNHTMPTAYEYNSLNQLVKQNMPDHDPMDIWEFTLPNGLDSRLKITATQFVNSTKGYLCGYITISSTVTRGYMYSSEDGGATWTKMNDLVASDLKKVQMVNATIGYAVGSNGIVLKTTDGANSWDMTQLYNNSAAQINDLYFTNITNGVIVGNNGLVLKTSNGGVSFSDEVGNGTIGLALGLNYSSITSDAAYGASTGYFYVTGNAVNNSEGQIFRGNFNTGFGITWTPLLNVTSPDMNKVRMIGTSDIGYAIGIDGTLLSTIDNGGKWLTIATGTSNAFKDIYFTSTLRGVAIITNAAGKGQIWNTEDGGKTWALLSNATDSYNAFNFYSSNKGYAVGNSGKIKRVVFITGSVGLVNIPTSTPMQPIDLSTAQFSDDSKGWVAGNSGKLYYTMNGTASYPNWVQVNSSLTGVKDMYFGTIGTLTNNTGVVLSTNGGLYKLISNPTPSGVYYALTPISTSSESFVSITATNSNVYGYDNTGTGNLKTIFKASLPTGTSMTVVNHTSAPTPTAAKVVSILARNATSGTWIYTTGTSGEIFRADLSATTIAWVNQSKNTHPLPLNDIQAAGAGTIYAVGVEGSMLQTTNSGSNWIALPTATTTQLNAIKFNTTNFATTAGTRGLIAGDNGKLWEQTISGTSVVLDPVVVPTTENLYDIALNTANKAYIAGGHGTILSTPDFLGTIVPVLASPKPGSNFMGICFKYNGNDVYAVGDNSALFNYLGTLNSGVYSTSGAKIKSVFTSGLTDVNFVNTENGYTVGYNDVIRHTDNGGVTWQYVAPKKTGGVIGSIDQLNGVWTTQVNRAVIIGNSGYKANIGGATGTIASNTSMSGGDLFDIAVRAGTGYIVGKTGKAYKTTNNGVSWTALLQVPGANDLRAIHIFSNTNTFMAVGSKRGIFFFNGSSWIEHSPMTNSSSPSIPITEDFKDVFFHDDRNGYVVGDNGIVLRCSLPQNISTYLATGFPAAPLPIWTIRKITGTNGVNPAMAAANVTVNTIDFASRYHGFLGGLTTNTTKNYARLVDDESFIMSTRFWYDRLGRMVVSQNIKQYNRKSISAQLGRSDFSYTKYDDLGRIAEVGEKTENSTGTIFTGIFGETVNGQFNPNVINDANLLAWINGGTRREVTHTYYDNIISGSTFGFAQDNLRKRVSSVTYEDVADNNPLTYQHATHYSYDIHGNVKTLVQDNKQLYDLGVLNNSTTQQGQRFKQVDYEYDLISGKVNLVRYQDGQLDAYYHFYEYDADNRITAVYTSSYPQANTIINQNTVCDNLLWEKDAKYKYYAHGPLARVEVGNDKSQGMDYAYTLQGWIKGVNSNLLNANKDMGQDGVTGGTYDLVKPDIHKDIAKDAFGYTLNYRTDDYKPINTLFWSNATNRFEAVTATSDLNTARHDLFNGNISAMVTTLEEPKIYTAAPNEVPNVLPQGTAYKYDQLNRLMDMKAYTNVDMNSTSTTYNTWLSNGASTVDRYRNSFTYDANGNILTQQRANVSGVKFDRLTYQYSFDQLGYKSKNRLYHVNDAAASGLASDDIDDQGTFNDTPADPLTINDVNNYRYDEIGNLKHDEQEQIDLIEWTVYGKIKRITRITGSLKSDLEFNYDASGNRISKIEKPRTAGGVKPASEWITTYYARDAQGNIMCTYKQAPVQLGSSFKVIERNIFGSSRLGTDNTEIELVGVLPTANPITRTIGNKHYEGANHLGNVLVVFTDKKYPKDDNSDGIIDYYQPDIASTQDYYPFGAPMPERSYRLVMKYTDASHTTTAPAFVNGNEPVGNIASEGVKYRAGFNGQEKDDEVDGNGNSYSAEYWEYDSRLGRRWNIDPESRPMESPYAAFLNCPILINDPTGASGEVTVDKEKSEITVKQTYYYFKPKKGAALDEKAWKKASITEKLAKEYVNTYVNGFNSNNFKYTDEDGKVWNVTYKIEVVPLEANSEEDFNKKVDNKILKGDAAANKLAQAAFGDPSHYQEAPGSKNQRTLFLQNNPASPRYSPLFPGGSTWDHEVGHGLGVMEAFNYSESVFYKPGDNPTNAAYNGRLAMNGEINSYAKNRTVSPYVVALTVAKAVTIAKQQTEQVVVFHLYGIINNKNFDPKIIKKR